MYAVYVPHRFSWAKWTPTANFSGFMPCYTSEPQWFDTEEEANELANACHGELYKKSELPVATPLEAFCW
jgi:hypothetical protein